MKRLLLVLSLCIILSLLSACGIAPANSISQQNVAATSKYTVVIDAGHGGPDCGTVAADGTPEKEINLSVATILSDYLQVCGIRTFLVRDGDYELYGVHEGRERSDLYNRLDFVNSVENAILISIHQNYYTSPEEWGTQIWYSANTPESKVLADDILKYVKAFLQPDNKRENKESGSEYYILYKATVPSVMVECGFMSNVQENELLKDTNYQKNLCFAITAGICGDV